MTEKAIRAMLDTAVPAEAPLVMLYLMLIRFTHSTILIGNSP
jgi:hypothetical protein